MIEIAQACRCGKVTKLPLSGEPVQCACGWRLRLRLVVWAEPPISEDPSRRQLREAGEAAAAALEVSE